MGVEFPDPQLAQTIGEAAFDPAKWTDVCTRMACLTSAEGGIIVPTDVAQRLLGLPHSAALDGLIATYLDDGWYKQDLRERSLPTMLRRGYVTDADCIAYDEIDHSSYYQDLLRPAGLRWFLGIGFQTEQSSWLLSLQRSLLTEPFSESEIDKALAYRDVLNNSAAIARHLGFARVHGAANVLEQHGLCAIALDANERVVHVSPAAEKHINNGLQIRNGKLSATRVEDAPEVTRLISGICRKYVVQAPHHLSLPRANGKPPLVLYGCKLPETQRDVFQPAVALLVISDPERPQHISPDLLADYFSMTPAEAGLAAALARGASTQQYAADNHISMATARNHLQAALRKTSTHRQGELVAALNKVIPRNDFDL